MRKMSTVPCRAVLRSAGADGFSVRYLKFSRFICKREVLRPQIDPLIGFVTGSTYRQPRLSCPIEEMWSCCTASSRSHNTGAQPVAKRRLSLIKHALYWQHRSVSTTAEFHSVKYLHQHISRLKSLTRPQPTARFNVSKKSTWRCRFVRCLFSRCSIPLIYSPTFIL